MPETLSPDGMTEADRLDMEALAAEEMQPVSAADDDIAERICRA
jgi:hypothetical protein